MLIMEAVQITFLLICLLTFLLIVYFCNIYVIKHIASEVQQILISADLKVKLQMSRKFFTGSVEIILNNFCQQFSRTFSGALKLQAIIYKLPTAGLV